LSRPSLHTTDPVGHLISRVGLGAWVFGGIGWGPQDDSDSIAAIHRAVELGINWIDTAAVYGNGHAELVVGKALAALPASERPLVFTKGGVRIDPDPGSTYRDLSPGSLRAECEASLKRLQVQRIDLYQLHWPVDDHEIVEQAWHTLGELCREGKIRWAGVSNFSTALLERCARIHAIDSVQLPLSLLDRQAAESELPWAADHGVPALIYSPLESGLLSGSFSLERLAALPADDWRQRRARFQSPQVERTFELVELLRLIASGLGVSLVEVVIAWTLHWPAVSGAIVGARSPRQVEGWIGAADLTLGEDVLGQIEATLAKTRVGAGPRRPPLNSRRG
jgi:aryl-alcohol dehydrogenase-like predicted oxidoreductase